MKQIFSLCVLALLIVMLFPFSAFSRSADSILLSKLIWGMPSDRLARALKLDPSQYTVLHDPGNMRITIFETKGETFNFPEFRTVYLNFDPTDGLFKISGIYKGTLADVVKALKQRYGEPDFVRTSSIATLYRWEFDSTALSIINAKIEILPK